MKCPVGFVGWYSVVSLHHLLKKGTQIYADEKPVFIRDAFSLHLS
jgi:hypothetical protein